MMKPEKVIPPLNRDVQWMMLRGTKPALQPDHFGPSRQLYDAITRRFSLRDQYGQGVIAQHVLEQFYKSVRPQRIVASRVILPSFPTHEVYVMAAKGHKEEAAARLVEIIKSSPAAHTLLASPDLMAAWQAATTAEARIVGGYDTQRNFLFMFNRASAEDAKSLFAIPENAGRYKPRPERDPAFFSYGSIGFCAIGYPQQIEMAREHLLYFMRAGLDEERHGYCFVTPEFARENFDALRAFEGTGIKLFRTLERESPLQRAYEEIRHIARFPTNALRYLQNVQISYGFGDHASPLQP